MISKMRWPWTCTQPGFSPHARVPLRWPDSIAVNLVIAGVIGFGYTLLVLGFAPLDPANLSWLYEDASTYYVGWELFRQDPHLHWPLTFTDRLGYPLGDSIAFMDPNPLLMILLKPLSPLLPTPFQYLGIAAVLAVSLQFFFATRLFRLLLGGNMFGVLLPSLFFLMAPPLTVRLQNHYTLANHWLLVAALCVFVQLQQIDGEQMRKLMLWCGLLGGVAVGVNPYLAFMVLMVMGAGVLTVWWRRRLSWKTASGLVVATGVGCLLFALPLGLLRLDGGYGAGGYRAYAMELLAPLNPGGTSLFLRPLGSPSPGSAFEGYNYLGAGVLMLAVMLLPSCSRSRVRHLTAAAVVPLALVCVVLTALAVSTKVSAGSWLMIDLDPHERLTKYLAVFRGSGRLFWVPYYIMLTAIFATAFRLWRPRQAAVLVFVALLVQFADTLPLRGAVRTYVSTARPLPFQAPQWSSLGHAHANLLVFPPWQCGADTPGGWDGFRIFGMLAAAQGMRTNSYYAARYSPASLAFHCDQAVKALMDTPLSSDSAYVVSLSAAAMIAAGPTGPSACHPLDGFIVCSTKTDFGLGPSSFLEVPFMYPSGRIESWTDAANSGYFIGAWHHAEPHGIWSKGHSIVQFRLNPEQRSRYHAVSLQLAVPVGPKGRQYRIQSGSHEQSGTFEGHTVPRIEPFEVRVVLQDPPDGIERIVLTTGDVVRPADIGITGDARPLGLFVQDIRLIP